MRAKNLSSTKKITTIIAVLLGTFLVNLTFSYATPLLLPHLPCTLALSTTHSYLDSMLLPKAPTEPYVRVHQRRNAETGGDLKVVVFPAGTYRSIYEEQLKQAGYFAMVIKNPSVGEVLSHPSFMYGPSDIFWLQSAYLDNEIDVKTLAEKPVREWFNAADPELRTWIMRAAPKSKDRSSINKRLSNMEKYHFELKPMTLGDYEEWNKILFVPEVSKKQGGLFIWPATGTELIKRFNFEIVDSTLPYKDQVVKNRYLALYRNDQGQLVAGSIFVHDVLTNHLGQKESRVIVGAAVYNEETRAAGAATRVLSDALKLSRELGRQLKDQVELVRLSYGSDPNFYMVNEVDPRLQEFKLNMGFTPTPKRLPNGSMNTQLVKVLNTSLSQIDDRKQDPTAKEPMMAYYVMNANGDIELKVITPQ